MLPAQRRTKIGVTVDPRLAATVDAYVATHPGTDRSGVIDEALQLWYARQQAIAMAAQFSEPVPAAQEAERRAWKAVRVAAAKRRSARPAGR